MKFSGFILMGFALFAGLAALAAEPSKDPTAQKPKESEFSLFEASPAEVEKHFGKPVDTRDSKLPPATKMNTYDVKGLRITVHFYEGKAAYIIADGIKKKMSQADADWLFGMCGTKWQKSGKNLHKSSEGAVAGWFPEEGAITVQSAPWFAVRHKC